MNRFTLTVAQLLVTAALVGAQPATDEEALKKDLTAVIALHGQPCGEVIAVTVLGQDDYAASCKDGNKYHVYLKEGRVVVEKQK
jgi:hypothetical protein